MAISRDEIEKGLKQADIRANEVNKQISENDKRIRNEKIKNRVSYIGSNTSGLFGAIIIILVAVSLIRILYSGSSDIVTFGSLLDLLKDVPPVSTNVKNFVQQLQFTEPWVILDGLRMFLNSVVQIVSIGVWMASSLLDVIFFVIYFLLWIFI